MDETTKRLAWKRELSSDRMAVREAKIEGTRLTAIVWRNEPGMWGWELRNDATQRELPSFQSYRSPTGAQRAAEAWWQKHGANGVRSVRRLFMGSRQDFLAHTGAED